MYGVARKDFKVDLQPVTSLAGKTFCIVGGTGGVGQAIAKEAASKGADVTVVGRTFKDAGVTNITFVQKDLSDMRAADALGRELPPADYTVLTTGIVPGKTRETTPDGIEKDMAVSCLSRLLILRGLTPRLNPGARVFVYGMPGNGEKASRLDDVNSEKAYAGGFGFTHMNTVAANEALVHALAAPDAALRARGVSVFGVNPGLLVTDIRGAMHGGRSTWSGAAMEWVLGRFTPALPKYAATMVSLFAAPGLDAHSGALFGQKGTPILPNKQFAENPARAGEWVAALDDLLKTKAGL
ncbi:hypothetical protein JKP88DRAFT_197408 [Tribonema minus]|uniref:Oxidoreductase n=1 Tax=Tribonema minus TaxID=303371 RepID=A0A835Z9F8_9STRA|nr:hypothetical protein JKP88DRAFT_197408 [Tribonema minus]